ncbi:beta-lactamase [Intrasporangium oryzae NRRL B-24470]|uniref:Beta-lactamase n=1 Tax=Intrasporangium oryzae NRRL B-24470 TaxID=1386089 RepID=W9G9R3_9MICO|nr:beta-lactamase [Intrasporangium oryzae NRRL B-24470]
MHAGLLDAVTSLRRRAHVPGLSLAVVDRDRLVFAGGFGAADLAGGRPATPSTAYLWFSLSKLVTATAALRLAEEGRLDLDAPVGTYVDHLTAPGPRQPTVRQLLDHTAGLANPLPIRWAHAAGDGAPDPAALLRRVMSRRRAYRYPVGESARYTNLGYLAAGEVISTAAGRPFEEYVRQAVLGPAGMHRTGFAYRPDANAATGYVRAPRAADPVLRRLLPAGVAGPRHAGHLALNRFHVDGPAYGGLVGDVLDAGRFLRLHLGDGEIDGTRILRPETTRAMRELNRKGKPFDHGVGWFRRPTRGRGDWVEHLGTGAGFWNIMRLYPDRGLGVVVMTNSTSGFDVEPLFELLVEAPWS